MEVLVKAETHNSLETHVVTINFTKLSKIEQVNNVLSSNGEENMQILFVKPNVKTLEPIAYFTFANKQEFYCTEMVNLPVIESQVDKTKEFIEEKFNNVIGTMSSVSIDDVKSRVTDGIGWAKGLLGKK